MSHSTSDSIISQTIFIIDKTVVRTSNLTIVHICCWTPEHTAKMRVFRPVDVHCYLLAIRYWNCIVLDKEYYQYTKDKGKVFPLQAQCGPEGG